MRQRLSCPACGEGKWEIAPNNVIMVDNVIKPIKLRCTDCGHRCLYMDLLWTEVKD